MICEDFFYYLTPFLNLKTIKHFSQTSSFCHQVVFKFFISENKFILSKFKKYSQNFFDQGSKIISSHTNNYSKQLIIYQSLLSCLKHFDIVKKTLKRARNIQYEDLFCHICVFLSNKKFNRYFLPKMDDLIEFFPKTIRDEIYNQNEQLFLPIFPNYPQSDQCDEVIQLIEALSSSTRPLRKYHQLLAIDGIEWARTIQKSQLPELLANIYQKRLSPEQTSKSLQSMKNTDSFHIMSHMSQVETMTHYIGSVCLHHGYPHDNVIEKLCFQINQMRFKSTFFALDLVQKRFDRLIAMEIEGLASDLLHEILQMREDQFEMFIKHRNPIFCNFSHVYRFFSILSKLNSNCIDKVMKDERLVDFLKSDISILKHIDFLFCCLSENDFNNHIKNTRDHRLVWKGEEQGFRKVFKSYLSERTNELFFN
jgi:hypothetical protein